MGTVNTVIDDITRQLYRQRPSWIKGSISPSDMECLYASVLKSPNNVFTEVGIASGVSSSIILTAMAELRANGTYPDGKLFSYDLLPYCYWDENIPVGQAVEEMVPEQKGYMTIRTKMTAVDMIHFHRLDSIGFSFIDANHQHPWPAIDLLAVLPYMHPNGIICLHDINLPLINENFPCYGVKHLFEGLDCQKDSSSDAIPNTGVVQLNADKSEIAKQTMRLIETIDWEASVPDEHLVKMHFNVDRLQQLPIKTNIT